jgi:hypothetical protein
MNLCNADSVHRRLSTGLPCNLVRILRSWGKLRLQRICAVPINMSKYMLLIGEIGLVVCRTVLLVLLLLSEQFMHSLRLNCVS